MEEITIRLTNIEQQLTNILKLLEKPTIESVPIVPVPIIRPTITLTPMPPTTTPIIGGGKIKIKRKKVPKGSSLSEVVMREILEELTGKKWPSIRPDWLRSSVTGYNLELDCYCEELKLACEYNGSQHYKIGGKYVKNEEQLIEIQKRDLEKLTLAKQHGVVIMRVDSVYTSKNRDTMRNHLISRLQENGILLPQAKL